MPAARVRRWLRVLCFVAVLSAVVEARDVLRPAAPAGSVSGSSSTPATAPSGTTSLPPTAVTTPQDRLSRATLAINATRQMQAAARALATAGANNLRVDLPAVPVNSFNQANGLLVATGVPKNLANPQAGENAQLWVGAALPTATTDGTASTVTVRQTQQQSLLTWDSFNLGRSTSLVFDQSLGGANVGQWIAFNYVRDPSGHPSQILGSLKADGQVYVMNSNGIIFGGSSQVNTHALVASSLPINANLIRSGVLSNPDAQFLFSALAQPAGSNGPTPAFDPAVAAADGLAPVQTPLTTDGTYGDVVVQPGATLTAPSSADHVGGRIALVGPNVTNAGSISTPDGQTILAAGLQVGFAPHNTNDPTLRGLDVYVGKVADDSLPAQPAAGTVTNAGLDATNLGVAVTGLSTATTNPSGLNVLGLIEAPRGSVYLTGKTVNQSGVISSSTSVSFNGRVDLVAGYNAISNSVFGTISGGLGVLPFVYQSSPDNDPANYAAVPNTGAIALGKDSTVAILPATDDPTRVVGDLALPSQVNLQGQSIHFAADALVLAPGAGVPAKAALGADGMTFTAGAMLRAGSWFFDNNVNYQFVSSDRAQQIYLEKDAAVDVSGLSNVAASVTENIVAVELRGSELANSPLQRDGALRGQTIQVDVRQHGAWNSATGSYAWVGTPLADTSGWIGLTTHSIGELSVNGGSVAMQAGGAVVLASGSAVDVSGGSIAYAGGVTHTTQVITNGHVVDISKATPNLKYDGVFNSTTTTVDPKWGISSTAAAALAAGTAENAYMQGGNGGSLSLTAPVVALDGSLRGATTAGLLQRTLSPLYKPDTPPNPSAPPAANEPGWLLNALNRPVPGQLSLTIQGNYFVPGDSLQNSGYFDYAPNPAQVVFTPSTALATQAPADAYNVTGNYLFGAKRKYEIDLSPSLVADGANDGDFGILRIVNSANDARFLADGTSLVASPGFGTITVSAGTSLALPAGGSLSLAAGDITVEHGASVSVPGGAISLSAYDVSSSTGDFIKGFRGGDLTVIQPVYDAKTGNIVVDSGATLSAAGTLLDNRFLASTTPGSASIPNGGSITLAASDVSLAGPQSLLDPTLAATTASVLDVSGGADVSGTGKFAYGSAGKISIKVGTAVGGGIGSLVGGALHDEADLRGYAGLGKAGGALVLQVPSIEVTNVAADFPGGVPVYTAPSTGKLFLSPEFFSTGGFSSFDLGGLGVTVGPGGAFTGGARAFALAAGVSLRPSVQSWRSLPGAAVYTPQPGLAQPVSLTFQALGQLIPLSSYQIANDNSLVLDAGSTVDAGLLGSVSLKAYSLDLLGGIVAPGGTVSVVRGGDTRIDEFTPTVHFGPASVVDVSGAATYTVDTFGYHANDVADGGTITMNGNIVAEGPGAVKDATGHAVLDGKGQPLQGTGAFFNVAGGDHSIQVLAGASDTKTLSSQPLVTLDKQSNGGTLSIAASNELLLADGVRLLGNLAGADKARGGELKVQSQRTPDSAVDPVLDVGTFTPGFSYHGLGQSVTDATGDVLGGVDQHGMIWLGTRLLDGAGFGALTLSTSQIGAIRFNGAVGLRASRQISVADQGVIAFADVGPAASLTVIAPYVQLGAALHQPSAKTVSVFNNVSALAGTGALTVEASDLIDVGDLSLQNASTVMLDATYVPFDPPPGSTVGAGFTGGTSNLTTGAIRGAGTLEVAGTITLRAGQIYPPTATTFNVIAADYTNSLGDPVAGVVNLQAPPKLTTPGLPLSAGGTLNVSASTINQGGVLRAPGGEINLGAGTDSGVNPLSREALPTTTKLQLLPGSITSASTAGGPAAGIPYGVDLNGNTWVDPTGAEITTTGPVAKSVHLVATDIEVQAASGTQPAAKVDLAGGGDLFAYRFVPGTGGTNDILEGSTSGAFAVIPGFVDQFAPLAPYATDTTAKINLGTDTGYTIGNASLHYQIGDRVHLEGGAGLPAGDYTLLPARYALLDGAFLVKPLAGSPTAGAFASVTQPDGASVVAGYRFNGFDPAGGGQGLFGGFEVAPHAVVARRAEYDVASGNKFFADEAAANATVAPRRPVDAGQLQFVAGATLKLQGTVAAQAATGGRGGLIDISGPQDILIGSKSALGALPANTPADLLRLDAADLSAFGAESLVIGGLRTTGTSDTLVNVTATHIKVDNAGEALTGPDIVLVANQGIDVAAGSDVHSSGPLTGPAETLRIAGATELVPDSGVPLQLAQGGGRITFPHGTGGDKVQADVASTLVAADGSTVAVVALTPVTVPVGGSLVLGGAGQVTAVQVAGTGSAIAIAIDDGALLRVSSDANAQISRSNVAYSSAVGVTVGAGATVSGTGVILDSTHATALDGAAAIKGQTVSLDSGGIAILLNDPGAGYDESTLLLTNGSGVFTTLQKNVEALSLLSYTSIDFYGSGTVGALDNTGQPALTSLGLHAGAIRGFSDASAPDAGVTGPTADVTVVAKNVTLDNSANVAAPESAGTTARSLTILSDTLTLGRNRIEEQGFSTVKINATNGVTVAPAATGGARSGTAAFEGDLTISTPLLTGAVSTQETVFAGGALALQSPGGASTLTPGLAASLSLSGDSVTVGTKVSLPGGNLSVEARTGDLTVDGGTLEAGGAAQSFYDVTKYIGGGHISLVADAGDLAIADGSKVSVSAQTGGGDAGTVTVSAPAGHFTIAPGTLSGWAGAGGAGGTFQVDALNIPGDDETASHLQTLADALTAGGFNQAVSIRLRSGDVVADGTLRAHTVDIAADTGALTVAGAIDASGFANATRDNPLGGTRDGFNPTGGDIALAAADDVTVLPTAWLSAAGYAYNDAGKGGTIALSAGNYRNEGGAASIDAAAKVEVQAGAQLDLGVKNNFTVSDLELNPGTTPPASTRTDLVAGTLHVRETQTAFGSGAQFAGLADAVHGASGVVLEGNQVFDLTGTNGAVTTSGPVTSIGSGGLINSAVQNAVLANGAAFVAGLDPALAGQAAFHVRPGAEIVNNAALTGATIKNFVTLNSSVAATRSVMNFTLAPGSGVTTTVAIPGGLPAGVALTTTAGRIFTTTLADGTVTAAVTATPLTKITSANAANPVVAVNFRNTSNAATASSLSFNTGNTPVTLMLDPAVKITSANFAGQYSSHAGDLTLATNWDLSGARFSAAREPGQLTLRARGNVVLGFDASLSDGFDSANPVDARFPLWTAPVMSGSSWSYRLVAGADFTAANGRTVVPLAALPAGTGSVLVGLGGRALPTATGPGVTNATVVPGYFQTIRTGTGDIDLEAGRDVQLLSPLASIYTAGTQSAAMTGFELPLLGPGAYPASYSQNGGNVTIRAQNDIARYQQDSLGNLVAASSEELPNNWLDRRGHLGADGFFAPVKVSETFTTETQSTSWWIDFSNFFDDVGALGGGQVTLAAGRNISNVNASAPTNARMPAADGAGAPLAPAAANLLELGGGDVALRAGADLDGGVYYVERGNADVRAGGSVHTNATRAWAPTGNTTLSPVQWLPTSFLLGKGDITVAANGDILMGPVANTFLLPAGLNNQDYERTFFSTYDPNDAVDVTSIGGQITFQDSPDGVGPLLSAWYYSILGNSAPTASPHGASRPWLRVLDFGLSQAVVQPFSEVSQLLPGTLRATAFSNDINLVGSLTLAPAPNGTIDLLARDNIAGLAVNTVIGSTAGSGSTWGTAEINLSDASPSILPGVASPLAFEDYLPSQVAQNGRAENGIDLPSLLAPINLALSETGSTNLTLAEKLARHGHLTESNGQAVPLHAHDTAPVRLYATGGDLTGLTFYSGKSAHVVADADITDVAFYLQDVRATDASVIAAGRDIIGYDPGSALRLQAQKLGNTVGGLAGATSVASSSPNAGDFQLGGPGTLTLLAGRNLDLGSGSNSTADGTAVGVTTVGAVRNPYLPQNSGANIVATAGVGPVYAMSAAAANLVPGLASLNLDYAAFIAKYLDPATAGAQAGRYLPKLGTLMGLNLTNATQIWTAFGFQSGSLLTERQAALTLAVFQLVLRDAARDRNNPDSPTAGTYDNGFSAITTLLPGSPIPTADDLKSTNPVVRPAGPWQGDIALSTREIKTFEGGNVSLVVPGGNVTVGRATDPQTPDQGVLTQRGGSIGIYAADSVNIGTSRIFTLRGGDEIIWSTWGNIAAGSGSKTVFSAPPTRVLVDPQSGDVQNDLAGLATGSGIGVLATLSGVKPGDVDLVAPVGTIDAGDAGIRSSGNLNLAARVVLNASNIQVGGTAVGTPPPPPAPNLGSLSAASAAAAGSAATASDVAKANAATPTQTVLPSLISVEVLGYGGGEGDDDDSDKNSDDDKKKRPTPDTGG